MRLLLLILNAAAMGFLVYMLLNVSDSYMTPFKKRVIYISGIALLLLPAVFLMGFVRFGQVYLAVYPLAVFFFYYLIRRPD